MASEFVMGAVARPAAAARPAWARSLVSADALTTRLAAWLAQALLALCVACGLFQVASRFLFNYPSDWSEVLTRFMLIWMVYLGAAAALRQGSMVSVDLMHRLSRGRWKRTLEAIITVSTVGFLGVLVYWGFVVAYRVRFQEVAGLEVSMTWAYLALPVGAVFSIVAVLAHHVDRRSHELETAV